MAPDALRSIEDSLLPKDTELTSSAAVGQVAMSTTSETSVSMSTNRPSWSGMQRRLAAWRVELLLFLFVVALVGPLLHDYGAQQASRYALTAAIWEEQTVKLDSYEHALGIDRAVRDGHVYSDKAPLQPLLGVPFYAVYKAVGGESATTLRVSENLGLWWMTLWMSVIPLALLAVAMYRFARRFVPQPLAPVLAFTVGTMMLPFGSVLFGHELAALFLFLAFFPFAAEEPSRNAVILAGAAAGAAVAVEYTAAIGVIVLCGLVLWRQPRRFAWFATGGMPFVILLAVYHMAAFGSPLTHPYQWSAISGVVTEAADPLGIFSTVHPERVLQVFFAGRGFLIASPLVVLGLLGSVWLVRGGDAQRRVAGWVAIAMFAGYLGVVIMWGNPWGGESPGPRYMMPAIPFLAAGVAVVWTRYELLGKAAFAIGALTMGLATITDPLINREVAGGLPQWIDLAASGEFVPTVYTMALGPAGWLVHVGVAALVGGVLFRTQAVRTAG